MGNYIIETRDLKYTYRDGTQALRGINLKIDRGDKVAFMGANGSGKSTFFLNLNGIVKPTEGSVLLDGKAVEYDRKGLIDVRKRIGIVFQDPDDQLFSANVRQEISFGPLNLGFDMKEVEKMVDDIVNELNIKEFAEKPTHFLSGGQKKRVAIADVLIMNPDVIILDEPASGLDPKHIRLIDELIEKLNSQGITVLIATHDPGRVLSWADRVIIFHRGEVVGDGTPEEIFRNDSLLEQTNLEKPAVLEMYDNLVDFGIINEQDEIPKNMNALEECIRKEKNV